MINIIISSRYKINRKKIRQTAEDYLFEKGLGNEYIVNIVFTGKNKMKMITSRYKKEKEILPVLSFPYYNERTEDGKILGEIFVCYPLAVLLAAERNKKVDEIIIWLIKHGLDNLIKD